MPSRCQTAGNVRSCVWFQSRGRSSCTAMGSPGMDGELMKTLTWRSDSHWTFSTSTSPGRFGRSCSVSRGGAAGPSPSGGGDHRDDEDWMASATGSFWAWAGVASRPRASGSAIVAASARRQRRRRECAVSRMMRASPSVNGPSSWRPRSFARFRGFPSPGLFGPARPPLRPCFYRVHGAVWPRLALNLMLKFNFRVECMGKVISGSRNPRPNGVRCGGLAVSGAGEEKRFSGARAPSGPDGPAGAAGD